MQPSRIHIGQTVLLEVYMINNAVAYKNNLREIKKSKNKKITKRIHTPVLYQNNKY